MAPASNEVNQHFQVGNRCLLIIVEQRFLVAIQEVNEDSIRLSYPASQFPVAGMLMEMEFHDELGYARFETELLATPEAVGDGLLVRKPTEHCRTTHRGAWRIPADFNVILKSHVHPRRYELPVINLSAGGMLIQSEAELDLNDTVELKFLLQGTEKPMNMLGQIMHIHQPDNPEDDPLVGIRFINSETEDRKSISRYVWRRMRELYPDNVGFKGNIMG